jgi:hypothetical protein
MRTNDDDLDLDLDDAFPPLRGDGGDDEEDDEHAASPAWPPQDRPSRPRSPLTTGDVDAFGRRLCSARSKRSGRRCRGPAVTGRTTCRMHSGTSPEGPGNPNWKGGRYSRFLPAGLTEAAEALVNDPERLDLTQQLGVLNAMLVAALDAWARGGGGPGWDDLRREFAGYREARSRGDVPAMAAHLHVIERVIDAGHAAYRAREEARAIIQDVRRVAEVERKRHEALQSTTTAIQVYALVGRIAGIVTEEVPDPAALARISRRLTRILGPGAPTVNGNGHAVPRREDVR